ncbi:hypothetical protein EYC98_01155 [Halieaceae bacterium IMCC14734]|uniref:SPOR domain-containing protein n=1 Tax=Candidatus Litorirhabdus singularis TaxID=2518993 RepID=A0ABT3TAZ1_9GAMM|nr:hypothetical protein [Candidatus Litorirhabdus singularis]MCX2979463.1 hypothetical protein [Candidatus Litorirhabdus singularis]
MSRAAWIWVLLLLVVANAAAFWFGALTTRPAPSAPLQAASGIDTLVLVSELPPTKVAAMRRAIVGPAVTEGSTFELPAPIDDEQSVAGEFEQTPPGDAALAPSVLQDIVVTARPIGVEEVAPIISDATEVADDLLAVGAGVLQEITVSAVYFAEPAEPAEPPESESVPALVEAAPAPAQCWEYGPLDEYQLQQVVTALSAQGLTPTQRTEDIVVSADYWVYLGSDSISKLQRLQLNLSARGVDSYVISGGPLDGNLSLGLYSLESSALKVAEPLREEGYQVEVYLRPKETRQSHWLRLTETGLVALRESAVITQLPAAVAQKIECPAVN